jgi:hypothetical protein
MSCLHTNSYWAGIVRTCPLCFASYDRLAQAIEARRAETGTGSVHESAVATPCANPTPSEGSSHEQ